jgi:AcrR family transcriptional regulator
MTRVDGRQTRDATESKILDATKALLDGGASLAGLSVNRIVEQAGVSRATFYLHFSDKRGLIAKLAETELAEFAQVMDPFLDAPGAGREELATMVSGLVELWRDHAGVLSSLIELAEYDSDARETWRAIIVAIADRIAIAIEARRKDLSAEQVQTLAEVTAWMGERTCHQMIGRDSTDPAAARVTEALTDAVWRTIAP